MITLPGGEPKVLFIRFSSLGDVILTLPAVESFKAAFPRARVAYLTKTAFAPVLKGNPDIDRVFKLEDLPGGGDLAGLLEFCRGLEGYDLVVDLHRSLRSRLASSVVSADTKLGTRKDVLSRRLWTMGLARNSMKRSTAHVVDRYLDTLKPLGVGPTVTTPKIHLADVELEEAAHFLKSRGVKDPENTAVIIPGARWPNKCWTVTGFAAVGRWIRSDLGLELLLAGDEYDRERVESVKRNLSGDVTLLAGYTGLRRLAAILGLARVVLGNDSGPGHLAAAVGTPVVVLFGPTSEYFGFVPRGSSVKAISRSLKCRPCSLHGGKRCPRKKRACLDDIAPGEVVEAVKGVMRN